MLCLNEDDHLPKFKMHRRASQRGNIRAYLSLVVLEYHQMSVSSLVKLFGSELSSNWM